MLEKTAPRLWPRHVPRCCQCCDPFGKVRVVPQGIGQPGKIVRVALLSDGPIYLCALCWALVGDQPAFVGEMAFLVEHHRKQRAETYRRAYPAR